MKKSYKESIFESSIMLSSVIKWIVLSIVVGVVVGALTSFFLKLVDIGIERYTQYSYYYLILPISIFLSSFIILKLAPEAEGHGTEKVIQAVHKKSGKMDIKVVPIKMITALITLITGGSAGEEGPATQIGGGIGSFFAKIIKMDENDTKRLVICGVSAGFTGVLGSPVAGAVFTAEVLYIGKFSYLALLPSLISSYVSFMVGNYFGINRFRNYIDVSYVNNLEMVFKMILFGIFIGIVARLFIFVLEKIEYIFNKMNIYKPYKGIIGGIILVLVVFVFKNTDFIGVGRNVISSSLDGQKIIKGSFLAKMFTTSVTLGSGGSGGLLTPILYIGTTFGNVWAQIMSGNIILYSSIGMTAFLAACTNTPIASIILSMELFGADVGPYASIACVVSYLLVGHKSVYPTQVLISSKTPSIKLQTNQEICVAKDFEFINKYHSKEKIKIKH